MGEVTFRVKCLVFFLVNAKAKEPASSQNDCMKNCKFQISEFNSKLGPGGNTLSLNLSFVIFKLHPFEHNENKASVKDHRNEN